MIRENGLYVLMGSKPMCDFPINRGFPETEEERQVFYNRYHGKEGSKLPKSYEEYRQNCIKDDHLHHRKLWQNWLDNMNASVGKHYRFVSRKTPFGKQSEDGLFINVPNTLFVLHKHYEDFATLTGLGFVPEEVIEEIGDSASIFWERAFQSHYLMGLLFGYGERNAYLCDWELKTHIPLTKVHVIGQKDFDRTAKIATKKNIRVSDLDLPLFAVYSLNDPAIKTYKKERQFILKQLKNKDFLEATLERLKNE